MRKFTQLNGVGAEVILEHYLFDRQAFCCDKLQTINDVEKVGLILKSQEIFIYKSDINFVKVDKNMYKFSDGKLTIIVNKL